MGLADRFEWLTGVMRPFRPPPRNPLVLWLALFVAIGLFPVAVGVVPLPGGLSALGRILGQYGAIVLTLGFGATAVGTVWPRRDTGLVLEMCGSIMLVPSAAVYAFAVHLATTGTLGYAFWSAIGLSVGGLFRALQIGLWLRGQREQQ